MQSGTIVNVNIKRSFGTIYQDATQSRYFFYFDRVIAGPLPYVGAQVMFERSTKPSKPGALPYAQQIVILSDAAPQIEHSAKGGAA